MVGDHLLSLFQARAPDCHGIKGATLRVAANHARQPTGFAASATRLPDTYSSRSKPNTAILRYVRSVRTIAAGRGGGWQDCPQVRGMYAVPLDATEANSFGDHVWAVFCNACHGTGPGRDGRLVSDGTIAKVCNCCPASQSRQWPLTTPSAERQGLEIIARFFCWL